MADAARLPVGHGVLHGRRDRPAQELARRREGGPSTPLATPSRDGPEDPAPDSREAGAVSAVRPAPQGHRTPATVK